jgi:hypothetical protein
MLQHSSLVAFMRTGFFIGILLAVGCAKNETSYIPAADTARPALEAALNAWKSGQPVDSVKLGEKPVNLVDSRWQGGAKLQSFEVTAEIPPNPLRAYKVKVQTDKDQAASETTYLVVGIDPLLIYRLDDYERERKSM